jgi:pimeloyl-ACP methyl ester carboxylesterase
MRRHDMRLADGRNLRVEDCGEGAIPIVFHHGTPGGVGVGTALATRAGDDVRIVSYDRAGYGASSPRPGRSVANVVDDIAAVADTLGIERFSTWGWSGGGPHALATAALLGDRVHRCGVWASPMPFTDREVFLAGMSEANIEEFGAALAGRDALEPNVVEQTAAMLEAGVDGIAALFEPFCSDVDRAALYRVGDVLDATTIAALTPSHEGWLDDDIVFVEEWGFDLAAMRTPVAIWHGAHDLFAPPHHGAWLAEHIDGAVLHALPDDGHLTLPETRLADTVAWLTSA